MRNPLPAVAAPASLLARLLASDGLARLLATDGRVGGVTARGLAGAESGSTGSRLFFLSSDAFSTTTQVGVWMMRGWITSGRCLWTTRRTTLSCETFTGNFNSQRQPAKGPCIVSFPVPFRSAMGRFFFADITLYVDFSATSLSDFNGLPLAADFSLPLDTWASRSSPFSITAASGRGASDVRCMGPGSRAPGVEWALTVALVAWWGWRRLTLFGTAEPRADRCLCFFDNRLLRTNAFVAS